MRRVHRAVAAVVGLALAGGGLSGCTLSPVEVAVAGTDRNGTPVVGATDCSFGGGDVASLAVYDASELADEVIWSIAEDPYGSDRPGRTVAGDLPRPFPGSLDDVELYAVGDADIDGWEVRHPLADPLPEVGTLPVSVEFGSASPEVEMEIRLSAPPDTYWASVDGEEFSEIPGDTLRRRIAEECDDAVAFAWGRFWAVTGVTVALVVALWAVAFVMAGRQFRRARAAALQRSS